MIRNHCMTIAWNIVRNLAVRRFSATANMAMHLQRISHPTGAQNIALSNHSNRGLHLCRASKQQQQQPSQAEAASTSTATEPQAGAAPVTREFRALGSKVVETNVAFKGPEDQADFWEGEKFEAFGKALETYFVPGLIVLGILCGGIAAKTYNGGATAFVKPPTGPDAEPSIIIATPEVLGNAPSPSS